MEGQPAGGDVASDCKWHSNLLELAVFQHSTLVFMCNVT